MKKSIKLVFLALCIGLLFPQLGHGEKLYNAQTFTLTNGLKVYLIENHRVPVVSHMVVYRVGSADDPLGKSGLAHFMEHMMFKGPKGSAPERLMGDVNKIGGSVNASTDFDVTSYYEIVPRAHLEHFMKLEASRMMDLPVRLKDTTPEIQVVLEEENMRMGNNPMMQFYRDLYGAYFRHHPYGTMPIGWRHEIKAYTPQDVKNFHRRFYAPDNAFIILSGDLTLQKAKELVEKYYGGIAPSKQPPRKRVQEPALTSIIQVTKVSDRVAHPSVVMMVPAPTYDPENPTPADALDLAIYGLSNSATGLLYRRLVEDLKVATSFSMGYNPYKVDEAMITIAAQGAPGIPPEALKKVIQEEIKKIIDQGFTSAQLEKFKTQTLSTLDYLKDSLLGGANHLVAPLIKNIPLEQIETWPETTKALKLEDVNGALKAHLAPQYYVFGYLLPEKMEAPGLLEKGDIEKPQEKEVIEKPKAAVKEVAQKKVSRPKKIMPPKKPPFKKKPLIKAKNTTTRKGAKHA
tara:strand:- start:444 stop:1991 length:1548 start_codon:yes stop_codon:yes gene_type:complete